MGKDYLSPLFIKIKYKGGIVLAKEEKIMKFLDLEGVKTLYSALSLKDYPNNDTLVAVINAIDENKANRVHDHDERYYIKQEIDTKYNGSIIGLSVDGQTVTYITGDGQKHTFITQDTNTEYSLGTDEITGLTKLYGTTGYNDDGTMTQRAITEALNKKIGVQFEASNNTLIFTI